MATRYEPGVFPLRAIGPIEKQTPEESKADTKRVRQAVKDRESANKSKARKRDAWMCRFPRCVCHRLRLHPEVAHHKSKGIGGDHGERSHVYELICLCTPRHLDSRISLHKGTLRIELLTEEGTDGPVRWWVDRNAISVGPAQQREQDWVVIATEERPRVLLPLTHEQGALLERIAELAA